MKNRRLFQKRFSRDFTLPSIEAWVRGESVDKQFIPFIIAQREDDTVNFYYEQEAVSWTQDLLVKHAHEDKNFIPEIEKTILKRLPDIRPIYEDERILTLKELKEFIKDLEDAYTYCEPMWWFFEIDDPSKVSGLDLENLAKVRRND